MFDVTVVNFYLHRAPSVEPFAAVCLGPLYLVAAAERVGFKVEHLDYQLTAAPDPYEPVAIADFLSTARSSLLAVSCMTNMLPFLILGLRVARQRRPDLSVVLGGSAVSGLAREVIASYPEIDFVVSGEGEEPLVELLHARAGARGLESIAGLTYREGGDVRTVLQRSRRMVVDDIAPPAWHHLELAHYTNTPVLTARGCPYRCVFCDIAPNWDRLVGKRSIEGVIAEVAWHVRERGVTRIGILDDVFTLDHRRVRAFCAALRSASLDVEWSCMCRADLLDEDLADEMHRAGCRRVFLGVESGSPRVRRTAGKGLVMDDVEGTLAVAAARFDTRASFIVGFPFETVEDFQQTLLLMLYVKSIGATSQMSVLSPLPQAPLTADVRYPIRFDPALLNGMVAPRHTDATSGTSRYRPPEEVIALVQKDSRVFSAFYHFVDGRVEEKLALAASYGVCC